MNNFRKENMLFQIIFGFFLLFHLKDFILSKLLVIEIPGITSIIFILSCCSLIFFLNKTIKLNKTLTFITTILFLFIIYNFIIYGKNINSFVLGYYNTFLFLVYMFLFFNITIDKLNYIKLIKYIYYFTLAILITGWFQFFLGFTEDMEGYSYLRIVKSIYINSSHFFFMMLLSFVMSLVLYQLTKNKIYKYILFLIFISLLTTLSKRIFILIFIIYLMYILFFNRSFIAKVISISILVISLSVIIVFFGETIISRFDDMFYSYFNLERINQVARTAITITSYFVAVDYFPFGSSLGTFGGGAAATYYSPLYYEYYLNNIPGLEPYQLQEGTRNYLSDFMWVHIIAELGFIGSVLYVYIFTYPLVKTISIKNKLKKSNTYIFFIYSLYIIIFVEGWTSSLLEQGPFVYLLMFLIVFTYKIIEQEKKNESLIYN